MKDQVDRLRGRNLRGRFLIFSAPIIRMRRLLFGELWKGNQFWSFQNIWEFDDLKYENITNVFRITNGYEARGFKNYVHRFMILMVHDEPFTGTLIPDKEGKPSIARRYKYIPENMQQKVVDKYFDFHKGLSCK